MSETLHNAAPRPSKPKNGFAKTAMICGIVAFVIAWIPGLSFLAWLPAASAITLGVISLSTRKVGRGRAIAGVALSATGWLVAIIVSITAIGAAVNTSNAGSVHTPTGSPTPTAEPLSAAELAAIEESPIDPDSATAYAQVPSVVVADTTATQGTAIALLSTLPVKGRAPKTGYDRVGQFGAAWLDVDRNGCDTRNDILGRDLTNTTKSGACKVLTGDLIAPYTGMQISFVRGNTTSMAVQIDHVVPLLDAWETGAQQLTAAQRVAFANDPMNLLAVDGPTNSKKGAGDAATWLPSQRSYWCQYVARQISVKVTYGLWVTKAEGDKMRDILGSCPEQPALTSSFAPLPAPKPAPPAPAPAPVPAPVPAPAPAPAPPSSVYYANCAAARAAGAAPLHTGDPGYRLPLDRDKDGIACE